MNILMILYLEFFKIGLFSVGGGLATLPYLERLCETYQWFTYDELINMIAISESTPGPIGVNMATFAGYQTAGVFGGIVATLGIATPAVLVIGTIAMMLAKFKESKVVNYAFYGIRACVAALIASSCLGIMKTALLISGETAALPINLPAVALFAVLVWAITKFKKHPIVYIAIAAALGLFIAF